MTHVVFFDGKCGLCDHLVQWLLRADTKKQFLFAPLQGTTAQETLDHLPESVKQADSLILIENYKTEKERVYIYGKAAFRILWLLGNGYKAIGWLFFLPAFLYDWGYWIVAKNRKKLFGTVELPSEKGEDRFLP